ncbi:MAG: DUF501 domain-containing protein [Tetrasphaera sp.]|jgi:hypothetical protein|nr:DUF501 domain-containing protein [Tetrasphaera sp.]
MTEALDPDDIALVTGQLGREPRGIAAVAHRCPCGAPDVVATLPRLPDGTPFPTTFYLTCPRLAAAVSTLESDGVMREFHDRLGEDGGWAAAYERAHRAYLRSRSDLAAAAGLEAVPEIDGVSAGGMPHRVKCLHALAAHALAAGPGVNPVGDETLARLDPWWSRLPCADPTAAEGT